METQDDKNTSSGSDSSNNTYSGSGERRGRALAGLIIVAVGSIFLASKAGVEFPHWIFTPGMFLVVLGFFIGVKHSFRHWGWLIPVVIGSALLAENFIEGFSFGQFIWPIIIISIGLMMIFKPRRRRDDWGRRWHERNAARYASYTNEQKTDENFFDSTNIFGGSKKVVIAKDFRGGDLTSIFGGADINFTQADINGKAELDVTQIFGGAKLIVPSNWRVQTDDLVCIFGGLDDKRNPNTLTPDENKVLVIKGTCIFGGIDIRSF